MNRRLFLGLLGGAAVVELLPKRSYFFAPPCGWRVSESGIYTPGEALLSFTSLPDWYFKSTPLLSYLRHATNFYQNETEQI
jgi:hypothetical protein